MPIEYQTLSADQRDLLLAEAIHGHEMQHYQFDMQVKMETEILAALPEGDWPQEIARFRGLGRDEIIRRATTPEEMALAQQYAHRDHIRGRLSGAVVERQRVEAFHASVLSQLPVERRAVAFAAALAKREGAEPTTP